jgi:twitching motility protein PilU
MRGIISQRLIPTIEGKRAAAIEILLGTPRAADLIAKGDVSALKELMEKSGEQGMQTFDMSLFKLYKQGKISLDEALKNADSKNNLRLRVTLDERPSKEKAAAEAAAVAKDAPAAAKPAAGAKPDTPTSAPTPAAPPSPLSGLSLTPMDEDENT